MKSLPLLIIGCLFIGYNGMANGYRIGVGRADCTGPPVEVVFVSICMYVNLDFIYCRH